MNPFWIFVFVIRTGLQVAEVVGQLLGPPSALVSVSTQIGTLTRSICTIKYIKLIAVTKDLVPEKATIQGNQRFGASKTPP